MSSRFARGEFDSEKGKRRKPFLGHLKRKERGARKEGNLVFKLVLGLSKQGEERRKLSCFVLKSEGPKVIKEVRKEAVDCLWEFSWLWPSKNHYHFLVFFWAVRFFLAWQCKL